MPRKRLVEISSEAEQDIVQFHERIARDKPIAADSWVTAIRDRILSLGQFSERCEVIPEAEDFGVAYRHLIFGNYRIIYRVEERRVLVVRVIHAARALRRHMLPPS